MGHYQKKPYKKQTLDPHNDIDIKREYIDAFNDKEDPFEQDEYAEYQDCGFLDEPEIVRQLRKEELEGTLPLYLLHLSEESVTTMKNTSVFNNTSLMKNHKKSPQSYQECYEIAKKTLKKLSNDPYETIQFE
jgi:hypothetical protein